MLLFHPRCKQNFVVIFVSFFLELESIGTRAFKIVKIFEAWKTFFSNSYLGVLRLFLRVLEVARSRRLGSVGEVSVWPGENRDLRLFLGKNVLEPILESKVVPKKAIAFLDDF